MKLLERNDRRKRKIEPFFSVLYDFSRCNPDDAWVALSLPHVMMTMCSSIPSEERILVAEIQAFVAVMWNRLVSEKIYPEHNIVPVSETMDGLLLLALLEC